MTLKWEEGGQKIEKENFLTVRWINLLSLGLGLHTLLFVIITFSNDRACDFWGVVLTGDRITYDHAVRMVPEEVSRIRFQNRDSFTPFSDQDSI
mgnify:CR=1 FL=1